MSAQTGKISEGVGYDTQQQTPVIIKTGDGVPDSTDVVVKIDSPVTYFTEWGQELPAVSQSLCKGRLYELTIVDGPETRTDYVQPDTGQLASIRIEYDSVQLRLRESGNATTDDVVLVIESEAPFKAGTKGPWDEAVATFPRLTRVEFSAGNKTIVSREFTELERPKLVIAFPRTESA